MPEPNRRAELLAPWIGGVAVALPVLLVAFPPMADLPLHEMAQSVSLLRHWGDPAFFPHDVYFINPGQANQLFSMLMLVLAYAMPIAWGRAKVSVALVLVALPVAAARLADHLRAPRWTALLVVPLGIGWLFFWGLVQNLLGLTVLLALLPSIDRFASSPTRRGALAMCGAMVLLHFAHQAMQVCACIALVTCSLGAPVRLRETALRATPVAFSVALLVVANIYGGQRGRTPHPRKSAVYLGPPGCTSSSRFRACSSGGSSRTSATSCSRSFWRRSGCSWQQESAFVRCSLDPSGSLASRRALRDLRPRSLRRLLARTRDDRGDDLRLAHRLLPPAWAIFAVTCAKRHGGHRAPAGTVALARWRPSLRLLISWPVFVDADRMYSDLDALMPSHRDRKRGHGHRPGTVPTREAMGDPRQPSATSWRCAGGALFSTTPRRRSRPWPSVRMLKQWAKATNRMEKHPFELIPSWDLLRYRYLLVITPSPLPRNEMTALALRNDATLVGHEGDWYLFESRILSVPIDAPRRVATPAAPTEPAGLAPGAPARAGRNRARRRAGGAMTRARSAIAHGVVVGASSGIGKLVAVMRSRSAGRCCPRSAARRLRVPRPSM